MANHSRYFLKTFVYTPSTPCRDVKFARKVEVLHIWLIRYFLKTFVYTPSTPCRDVKSSQNIPLGDLS